MSGKVVINPDRYKGSSFWRRFPELASVSLISSMNPAGESEVFFKGMGMPFDEESPYYLLTCSEVSPVHKNITQWGEFVVNFPGTELMDRLHFWALNYRSKLLNPADIGLHMEAAEDVKPLRIRECYAHLECRLEREIYHQGYILIVGKILAGILDQNLVGSSGEIDLAEIQKQNKMVTSFLSDMAW